MAGTSEGAKKGWDARGRGRHPRPKAGGAIIGYPKGNMLQTWDGKPIAELRRVSTWKTPMSNWVSSTRSAYRATIGGKEYVGTGYGEGMSLKLRPAKSGGIGRARFSMARRGLR